MKLATSYNVSKVKTAFAASGENYSSISEATGIAVSTVSRLLQSGNGYSRTLLAIAKTLNLTPADIVLGSARHPPSIPTPRPFMSAAAQTKMGGKRAKQLARLLDDILSKPKPAPAENGKPARKSKQKADAKAKPKTTKARTPAARKTAAVPPRPKTTKAPKTSTKTKAKAKGRRAAKAGGAIDRLAKDFKFRERAKTGRAVKAKKR